MTLIYKTLEAFLLSTIIFFIAEYFRMNSFMNINLYFHWPVIFIQMMIKIFNV